MPLLLFHNAVVFPAENHAGPLLAVVKCRQGRDDPKAQACAFIRAHQERRNPALTRPFNQFIPPLKVTFCTLLNPLLIILTK
jgi:hypothetical protein